MNIKRVYVGGKISNLQFGNIPIFNFAAQVLREKGYEVVNPVELNGEDPLADLIPRTPEEARRHWQECMRRDIPAMLSCDTLALLDNWVDSEGAKMEKDVAYKLGLNVVMVADLLRMPGINSAQPPAPGLPDIEFKKVGVYPFMEDHK